MPCDAPLGKGGGEGGKGRGFYQVTGETLTSVFIYLCVKNKETFFDNPAAVQ